MKERVLVTNARLDEAEYGEIPIERPRKASGPNATLKKTIEKHVTFDSVDIREYDIEFGRGDLSITLSWRYGPGRSIAVDAYEAIRERRLHVPRGHLRRLNTQQRRKLLSNGLLTNNSSTVLSSDSGNSAWI
eukprot:scaffold4617_cov106-Cylindrotheca_fusiformis.AAC.1